MQGLLDKLATLSARILFQYKYSMAENVKINYKGDPSNAKSLWKCQKFGIQDSEIHLL